MIITGFTSVYDDDHLFYGIVRLSNNNLIEEHRKLVNLVHKENCKIVVQLALGEYKMLINIKTTYKRTESTKKMAKWRLKTIEMYIV